MNKISFRSLLTNASSESRFAALGTFLVRLQNVNCGSVRIAHGVKTVHNTVIEGDESRLHTAFGKFDSGNKTFLQRGSPTPTSLASVARILIFYTPLPDPGFSRSFRQSSF